MKHPLQAGKHSFKGRCWNGINFLRCSASILCTYLLYLPSTMIHSSQLFCRKVLFFHDWVKCALFLVRWVMSVKGFLEDMSHIATCSFNGKLIYAICYFYWVINIHCRPCTLVLQFNSKNRYIYEISWTCVTIWGANNRYDYPF